MILASKKRIALRAKVCFLKVVVKEVEYTQNVQMQGCEDRAPEVIRNDDLCEQEKSGSGRIDLLSKNDLKD